MIRAAVRSQSAANPARTPLKYVLKNVTRKGPPKLLPYVALEHIQPGLGKALPGFDWDDAEGDANMGFDPNDILFGKLRPYLAKVLFADRAGCCSSELLVLRPIRVLPRYAYWLLLAKPLIERAVATSTGVKMPRTRWDHLGREAVELPGPEKQRQIAEYLDLETAWVDELIEKKERLASLIRGQIHSFVREAIRGAPAFGEYVASAIGPVSPRWPVKKVRRLAAIFSGTTFPHEFQGRSEGDFPLYKVADLALPGNEIILQNSENWVLASEVVQLRGRVVPADAIVYPRVGAALLLNARRITPRRCLVDDNSRALHFRSGDARYWQYLMSLIDFGGLANPGAVPTISEGAVLSLSVPVPPDKVQHAIADAIDEFRESRHQTVAALERQVALLQERRQAVITAAVTGQLRILETV